MTQHPIAAICRTLKIGRATPYRATQGRPAHYTRADDRIVTAQIREIIRQRGAYGYRRVTALVNRTYGTAYNRKRIRRLMELNAWNLPRATRRRSGRAHTGRIMRSASNERWCSDTLEIACTNGEYIHLGFVLDCHDREAIAHRAVVGDFQAADVQHLVQTAVRARFGTGRPAAPLQFLSDNGSIYTALAMVCPTEQLGLTPITTPAYSPQSNGMSEAFVNTLRRDYLDGADHSTATALLEQVPAWFTDYNSVAPHSALRYRPPTEYRRLQQDAAHAANAAGAEEDTVSS
jgi:putative transposase